MQTRIEEEEGARTCGMCSSCGSMPPWAPERTKYMTKKEREQLARKMEEARLKFIAERDKRDARRRAVKERDENVAVLDKSLQEIPGQERDLQFDSDNENELQKSTQLVAPQPQNDADLRPDISQHSVLDSAQSCRPCDTAQIANDLPQVQTAETTTTTAERNENEALARTSSMATAQSLPDIPAPNAHPEGSLLRNDKETSVAKETSIGTETAPSAECEDRKLSKRSLSPVQSAFKSAAAPSQSSESDTFDAEESSRMQHAYSLVQALSFDADGSSDASSFHTACNDLLLPQDVPSPVAPRVSPVRISRANSMPVTQRTSTLPTSPLAKLPSYGGARAKMHMHTYAPPAASGSVDSIKGNLMADVESLSSRQSADMGEGLEEVVAARRVRCRTTVSQSQSQSQSQSVEQFQSHPKLQSPVQVQLRPQSQPQSLSQRQAEIMHEVATSTHAERSQESEQERTCAGCAERDATAGDLEAYVRALEAALSAREREARSSVRSAQWSISAGAALVARLRDENQSLRLTVDYLFRRLQKYERSPRDAPDVH